MHNASFPCLKITTTKSLRHLSLHSSNLLTVACMEMKLGAHVCNIISMTTTLFEHQIPSGNFLINYFFTSQTHAWRRNLVCMHVISFPQRLHVFMTTTYCLNNIKQLQALFKQPQVFILLHSLNLLMEMKLGIYACVLHHFHDDNSHFPLLFKIFVGDLPPLTESGDK